MGGRNKRDQTLSGEGATIRRVQWTVPSNTGAPVLLSALMIESWSLARL